VNRDTAVIARVLHDRVRDVPPPAAGLADRARVAARRRRRRQRMSAGAAALALGTAVVLAPMLDGSGTRGATPLPAHSTGPVVGLVAPPAALTVVDASALPAGPAPSLAWVHGGVLHRTDGREVPLPAGMTGAVEGPAGAFSSGGTTSAPVVRQVDQAGRPGPALDAPPPVESADGRVAYLDRDRGRLVTVDPDGVAHTAVVPADVRDGTLVGFLDGDAIAANVDGGPAVMLLPDGTSTPLPGLPEVTAVDGHGTVASRSLDGCLEVRHAGARLWQSCAHSTSVSLVAFAPDGHHVLLRQEAALDPTEVSYAVVDTSSGSALRLFRARPAGDRLGQAVFERAGTVMLAVTHRGRPVLVRCSLDGACERAVPDSPLGTRPWTSTPFVPAWVE
jgi:hypothetical protein